MYNWSNFCHLCVHGSVAPFNHPGFEIVSGPANDISGTDSATHMSEEIKDASRIVPRAMVATAVLNGIMGFAMIITYCFCIVDLDAALASNTGYPFIDVFYSATNSKGGATAMASILIVLLSCSCISALATASRQCFAFARDEGLPFSKTLAKVRLEHFHDSSMSVFAKSCSVCTSRLPPQPESKSRSTPSSSHSLSRLSSLSSTLAQPRPSTALFLSPSGLSSPPTLSPSPAFWANVCAASPSPRPDGAWVASRSQ